MTAITKAWVSIADSAVDPDSPIDTALMTGLRDNDVHLREWLGADYTAGAEQNHTHDGVNSAIVEWAHLVVYTSSGTWTVPDGVTRCKVTVVGGGGGGRGSAGNGGTGGTSSFGAFLQATGGAGGSNAGAPTSPGVGSGGDLNMSGGYGMYSDSYDGTTFIWSGYGGSSVFGQGSRGVNAGAGIAGGNYGGGGGAFHSSAVNSVGGAGGGASIEVVTGLTPGAGITVTVGAGGAAGSGSALGGAGGAGVVIIEY